jgi:hypothetical protein
MYCNAWVDGSDTVDIFRLRNKINLNFEFRNIPGYTETSTNVWSKGMGTADVLVLVQIVSCCIIIIQFNLVQF